MPPNFCNILKEGKNLQKNICSQISQQKPDEFQPKMEGRLKRLETRKFLLMLPTVAAKSSHTKKQHLQLRSTCAKRCNKSGRKNVRQWIKDKKLVWPPTLRKNNKPQRDLDWKLWIRRRKRAKFAQKNELSEGRNLPHKTSRQSASTPVFCRRADPKKQIG